MCSIYHLFIIYYVFIYCVDIWSYIAALYSVDYLYEKVAKYYVKFILIIVHQY